MAILELTAEPSLRPDSSRLFHFPMPARATAYARVLYATLRNTDGACFDRILAEAPPETAGWQAVHDRLRRAAILYCPTEAQP